MSRDPLDAQAPAVQMPARRDFIRLAIAAGAVAPGIVPGAAASSTPSAKPRTPGPSLLGLELDDPTLMRAFMKLRASTDERPTFGWVDAVNYGFTEGETFPLYRLLAATWQRFARRSDTLYEGVSLEVAYFLDMRSGEPLKTLTMPRTGKVVEVPLYRAGPSPTRYAVRHSERREFDMQRETRQGSSFFRPGVAHTEQYLSQPQREGDAFYVRHDQSTRVVPGDPSAPAFFYREWTVSKGDWSEVMDPKVACARVELAYSAMTAWRPWMQMTGIPGHTTQNGRGGKVQRVEELPAEILALTRRHHPELVEAPERALEKSA